MDHVPTPAPVAITDCTEFVFREASSVEEMRQVLALRYVVYSATLGLAKLPSLDHGARMDLDVYDLTSCHFALFARADAGEAAVGTLRIVGRRPSPMACALREIASAHPSLVPHLAAEAQAPLPMLSYLVQAQAVREVYERLVANGEKIAEPSRLTLHPGLRVAAARKGLKLSHYLMHCALAEGWHCLGLDRALIDCDTRLEPFYRRFGFFPVPGGEAAYQPHLGAPLTVLQATPGSLPAALCSGVKALARQLRDTGQAVLPAAIRPCVPEQRAGALVVATAAPTTRVAAAAAA